MGHLEVAYMCGHTGTEYFRGDKVDYYYYKHFRFCPACYKEYLAERKIKEAEKENAQKISDKANAIILINLYRGSGLAAEDLLDAMEKWLKSDTCEFFWKGYTVEKITEFKPTLIKLMYKEYKIATGYYTDNPTGYYGAEKTAAIAEVMARKPKQPECLKTVNAFWNGKVYASCIYLDGEKVILNPAEKKRTSKICNRQSKVAGGFSGRKRDPECRTAGCNPAGSV
ncbi:MAG: hypothetical protein LBB61_07865 [Treponema sp.]|nr:hypothetical protein [Treponema sp.]